MMKRPDESSALRQLEQALLRAALRERETVKNVNPEMDHNLLLR